MSEYRTVAQISTYPMDVRHVEHLLPNQIRAFSGMVEKIVVTIDTHQSRSGRYRGENFQASLMRLRELTAAMCAEHPLLEVADVDYSEATRRAVARHFFDAASIPVKAWDGGPFYAYFYGLYRARARYIFHIDSDLMFGGGSKAWMEDAIRLMDERPDVLVTAPLPGPPREDGRLFGHGAPAGFDFEREPEIASLAFRHPHMSTRIFMMDMQRFKARISHFKLLRPSFNQRLKSLLLGNPPQVREAEVLMSQAMQQHGLYRVDMLGSAPGIWTLHPPYRTEEFYRRLPEFVQAIETGDVPEAQRGDYELNDSMIDWTPARAQNRWYRRYWKMLRQRLQ